MPDPDDLSGQDKAETFDEENITPDGRDIATSDLQRDVYDVTSADEDAEDELAPQDDFDPDAADEAELELVVQADEDLDEPRSFAPDAGDLVADDDARPSDFESDAPTDAELEASGDDEAASGPGRKTDEALDRALEETFPASDPVAIRPGSD